ncbi:MAG: efflux RND transporter periplasmic adaptor subunit [Candidatus Andeanibacterium colombiense]|uniref:Efflux RND transporter periplasmic adaptor subunit n=1 Tax=Candidatus Andeanibacterium colombiense TaxID=3121345 RepID=A0AAJ5X918_9SPHN|nr:MAG: efflux RND transporter periplasmic adaptor subunit [Sphingomonadaceae bacterium]
MLNLRAAALVGLSSVALALAGCSGASKQHDRGPPTVGYVVVAPSAVPIPVSLGGRIVAVETSEVRPQVSGIIQRRLFTEGSVVRAGQPLYQIDPSLYRASTQQAQANLAAARASAEAARAKANRYKPLADQQAIALQDYTDAEATARQAEAAVAQASAALETTRINLRFATVTAPISGRIGRSLVTTGALASASQADPLAVIQRLDTVYVDMQQSSADLTALRQQMSKGQVTAGSTSVKLQMEDGSTYPLPGVVEFSEISVNESTGTVTLRARFPNPNGLLLPGSFVTAVFDQAVEPQAYLVPQAALQRDFDGSAFVYTVGADNKAKRRKVTAARTNGANWVVTDGLQRGDKVITQGLGSNIRQNSEVKPVLASTPQRIGAPKGAGGGKAGGKAG